MESRGSLQRSQRPTLDSIPARWIQFTNYICNSL